MSVYFLIRIVDMDQYESKLLPAYQNFMRSNEPRELIALANEAISMMSPEEQEDFDYSGLVDGIEILNGSVFYNSKGNYHDQENRKTTIADKKLFVTGQFAPSLLTTLCTPRIPGLVVEQNMSKTALYDYLFYCSDWISEVFTTARELHGEYLQINLCDGRPQLFSDEDIKEFLQVMNEVTNPNNFRNTADIYGYFCNHLKVHLKEIFGEEQQEYALYYEQYSNRFENWLKYNDTQLKKDFNNLINLLNIIANDPKLKLMLYLS